MSLTESLSRQLNSPSPVQVAALNFLKEKGFPTKKEETWKYTSLKPWLEKDYSLSTSQGMIPQLPEETHYRAVFINGCFNNELSQLPAAVQILDKEAQEEKRDAFSALNLSLCPRWSIVKVANKTILDRPLELLYLYLSSQRQAISGTRVQLEIGEDCSLALLERHLQQDDSETFVNVRTRVLVGRGSKVEYAQLQQQNESSFHFNKTDFEIGQNANVTSLVVASGAKLSRSELGINITDSGITAQAYGIYALTGQQQSDHYTSIRHHKGGSNTIQIYKGLLDGHSKCVFNGHVYIAQDAQKANSQQLNKNLLLSPYAEVNSKPELMIFADDVKATHGSTIGQLQKEELFYLRSRGIKPELAIQMLSQAFVMDVVEKLENPVLKNTVKELLRDKLKDFQGMKLK